MSHRIAVDIGGTFTDCVVLGADGGRAVAKSPTTHGRLADGVLEAVGLAAQRLGRTRVELLDATERFVHGTTVGTNAILTRTGVKTGLLTTAGHEDSILIGRVYAKRAGLPEREIVHASRLRKPDPIVPPGLIHGLSERVDARGDVVVELNVEEVSEAIDALLGAGVRAIAVCFLWSFLNDVHERRVAEMIATRAPDLLVALSSELVPVIGEYERTATTVLNAYLGPEVAGYLGYLADRLKAEGLRTPMLVMQGSGGLTSVQDAARRAIVTLDSGPAGGILGCQELGRRVDAHNLICTDVGGTSFDVGLVVDQAPTLDAEPVISQYVVRIPKIAVSSIGAGGGSIAWVDSDGLLRVGPRSAGSRPGPACYDYGGTEATLTDADLVLGYLGESAFLGGRMALRRDLALRALERLGAVIGLEAEEVAVGITRIACSQMADLIRRCTVERGRDPRDMLLVVYGGAGPTHAVAYGREIGARAIIVPADSTAFSAAGMLTCQLTHTAQRSRVLTAPFAQDARMQLSDDFRRLEQGVLQQFAAEAIAERDVGLERTISLRYRQQAHSVSVVVDPGPVTERHIERAQARFEQTYERVYGAGSLLAAGQLECELLSVTGVHRVAAQDAPGPMSASAVDSGASPAPIGHRQAHLGRGGGFVEAAIFDGDSLTPGSVVRGPAVIQRMGDSITLPDGWMAQADELSNVSLVEAVAEPAGAVPLEGRRS